jgi:transglutaminase/protease-like cytokinesis protein 3
MSDDPVGAYAALNITGEAIQIVSYYQVKINITYKVTKEQLDSIKSIRTIPYLQSDLQDVLSEYEPSAVVRENGIVLTEENVLRYVRQVYYKNPMEIVMLPVTTVDFYPNHGQNRIIKFTFGYTRYEPTTLRAMEISLKNTVKNIAESVSGGEDAILLSFCQHLIDNVEYDTKTAESGEYSDQNIAATAYGALVNGSAVGEGYAMAFKALCDELGLSCDVVLGQLNGKPHAWNIVTLGYYSYHIDVSMCDTNGIETAFLLSDTEMAESYTWDRTAYKSCSNGPLTYEQVVQSIGTVANASAGST